MQVRLLLGGFVDSLYDLRCLVRERLIGFVHRSPEWLPRQRMEGSARVQGAQPPGPPSAPKL
jgi:hypothetical protein